MRAVGRHGVEGILSLDKQDLAALDAFDLVLSLLAILEVDAGQALELVFGSHGAEGAGEVGSLGVQVRGQLCNGLAEERGCVAEGGEHERMRDGGVREELVDYLEGTTGLLLLLARHQLHARVRRCVCRGDGRCGKTSSPNTHDAFIADRAAWSRSPPSFPLARRSGNRIHAVFPRALFAGSQTSHRTLDRMLDMCIVYVPPYLISSAHVHTGLQVHTSILHVRVVFMSRLLMMCFEARKTPPVARLPSLPTLLAATEVRYTINTNTSYELPVCSTTRWQSSAVLKMLNIRANLALLSA